MSSKTVQLQLSLPNGQFVEPGSEVRLTVKGIKDATMIVGNNGWLMLPAEWRKHNITSLWCDNKRDGKKYKLKKTIYIPMDGDIDPKHGQLVKS